MKNDLKKIENPLEINKKKRINTIYELLHLIDEYNKLKTTYKNMSKIERFSIQEEINNLNSALMYGIKINSTIFKEYKLLILELCDKLEFETASIIQELSAIDLTVSPVELISKGKLCNYGKYISIDYSYAKFNKDGYFEELLEPKHNFFKHTLIHELLHTISRKNMMLYMDSFSEGMTDYFAHKISKATNIISDKYGFMEKVFYMFGIFMGDDELFDDYVNNISKMPKLKKFLKNLNVSEEDYNSLKKDMDLLLKLKIEDNNDDKTKKLEEKTLDFIFTKIINPYFNFDIHQSKIFFDKVFSDTEQAKMDLCEIHINKSIKTSNYHK